MREDEGVTNSAELEFCDSFSTVDADLANFSLPLGAADEAGVAVRRLDFEHVFVPHSGEHVAFKRAGKKNPDTYIARGGCSLPASSAQ
ncbi:hypothetical protein ACNI3K_06040 [Demequina sp. SO4-13]|uniref:hypothetical protein n=1 Tax=Demequina sp. SO4-13 TaxID=3401027 RepID=UPI003AF701A7